jgi:hypothetical protein
MSCAVFFAEWQRLMDAARTLKDRIQHVVDRADGRSQFYSVVSLWWWWWWWW